LKIAFFLLSSLRPETCQAIKKILIGLGTATLAEVKRCAIHHEHHGKEEKNKKEQKGAEYLTVNIGEVEDQHKGGFKGKGPNREGEKLTGSDDRNCFNCDKTGHLSSSKG
jgi:hypothetical protein